MEQNSVVKNIIGQLDAFKETGQAQLEKAQYLDVIKKFKQFTQRLPQKSQRINEDNEDQYFEYDMSFQNEQKSSEIERLLCKKAQKINKFGNKKKNWSFDEIKILTWIVNKYAQLENKPLNSISADDQGWQLVSKLIPGTTPRNCKFKWLGLMKFKLQAHLWTQKESNLLNQIIKSKGTYNWKQISQQLYIKNDNLNKIYRQPKQCRQHYASFLKPYLVKGPWTIQQDKSLLQEVLRRNGEKKWNKLSSVLKTRTQNAIKNRYNLLIKKMKSKAGKEKKSQIQLIKTYFSLKDNAQKRLKIDQEISLKKQEKSNTEQKIKLQEVQNQQKRENQKNQDENNIIKNQQKLIEQSLRENIFKFSPAVEQNQIFHNYHPFYNYSSGNYYYPALYSSFYRWV